MLEEQASVYSRMKVLRTGDNKVLVFIEDTLYDINGNEVKDVIDLNRPGRELEDAICIDSCLILSYA